MVQIVVTLPPNNMLSPLVLSRSLRSLRTNFTFLSGKLGKLSKARSVRLSDIESFPKFSLISLSLSCRSSGSPLERVCIKSTMIWVSLLSRHRSRISSSPENKRKKDTRVWFQLKRARQKLRMEKWDRFFLLWVSTRLWMRTKKSLLSVFFIERRFVSFLLVQFHHCAALVLSVVCVLLGIFYEQKKVEECWMKRIVENWVKFLARLQQPLRLLLFWNNSSTLLFRILCGCENVNTICVRLIETIVRLLSSLVSIVIMTRIRLDRKTFFSSFRFLMFSLCCSMRLSFIVLTRSI